MLSDIVNINEFFRRSVNINSDLNKKEFIEGYICPKSSEEALVGVVKHIKGTGQSSFTWTGPYGAGKSSLVLLFSSILSQDNVLREMALSRLSDSAKSQISEFFNNPTNSVIPIVGEPSNPFFIIGQSLVNQGLCKTMPKDGQSLVDIIRKKADKNGRVVLFIDEMGKFLESSSNGQSESDIYLFQQLAELANSSSGKVILIGILHQSFNEYARNLSKLARDEWSKIQGRFVDYHINAAGEEQLELVSRAIISDHKPKKITTAAKETAAIIKKNRPIDEKSISKILNSCWPLHPTVAALLGPISRRRFGQNQRSIFSFLNSAEPCGFKDFLSLTKLSANTFYYPDYYWDYIQLNLESSIVASSDAKLWALATDALARCEALGGSDEHIRILKTISVIDIFKGRSGLVASKNILEICGFNKSIQPILNDLKKWSLIRYKKYSDCFSIFEGSDFDLDEAIDEAVGKIDSLNFVKLAEIASFRPIVAKRHYHVSGALRWMDVNIVSADKAKELIEKTGKVSNAFGGFFIIVPTNHDEYNQGLKEILNISKDLSYDKYEVICGISEKFEIISSYSRELLALEWIEENRHEMLAGDSVARQEVETRKVLITSLLEELLTKQLNMVSWFRRGLDIGVLAPKKMMGLVSDIAEDMFNKSPIVKSEMLNRDSPSSNANAALNALLRAMLKNNGKDRFDIKGYPPEGGLFKSLLEDAGLYINKDEIWQLQAPPTGHKLKFDLLWKEADKLLSSQEGAVPIVNLYNVWQENPYGVKTGLLPFFATVFLLTRHDKVALYLNETYRIAFDDLFLDYLLKTPQTITLRWVDYDDLTLKVLGAVKDSINMVKPSGVLIAENASAFDIARTLVSVVDNLNPWVHRTRKLSRETTRFREIIKAAHDPNKLLFDDLPNILGVNSPNSQNKNILENVIDKITISLRELTEIYPSLLKELGVLLFEELQVGIASQANIKRLQERAQSIQGVTGDFRIDALAARLASFSQSAEDIAGIASLAANKRLDRSRCRTS